MAYELYYDDGIWFGLPLEDDDFWENEELDISKNRGNFRGPIVKGQSLLTWRNSKCKNFRMPASAIRLKN